MSDKPLITPLFILLPPGVLLLDVAGPAEAFYFANRYQQQRQFELHFVAAEPVVHSAIGLPLQAEPLPTTLPAESILLIPVASGMEPEWQHAAMSPLLDWLAEVGSSCQQLVTICAGALIAAKAGLLAGCSCTTHHAHSRQLAEPVHRRGCWRIDCLCRMAGSGAAPASPRASIWH